MSMAQFHYYTKGLSLNKSDSSIHLQHEFEMTKPDPWYSYKIEWFTLLKTNESKIIFLRYKDFPEVASGEYKAFFRFPSVYYRFYRLKKDDIVLQEGRIWFGHADGRLDIKIE